MSVRKIVAMLAVSAFVCCAFAGCEADSTSQESSADELVAEENYVSESESTDASETLRDQLDEKLDASIIFYDSVRNDSTGNWRLAGVATSYDITEYALDYYNAYFESDDEIHAVWNATLGTTSCVKVLAGKLWIDVHEYVDGEEHDANILFSGTLLGMYTVDLETGNVEKVEE